MLQRPFLILCVAVLAFLARPSAANSDDIRPQDIEAPERSAQFVAPSDLDMLTPQGVVRCPASDQPPEPVDPAITSSLPGIDRFVAGDRFKESTSSAAGVRISWLGATFSRRYLGKIEENNGGAVILRRFLLRRSSSSAEIIGALNMHHETMLADVWCLLSHQPGGESGTLLTDAAPNLFYIRDAEGVLGVVDAVWGGAGWEIGASAIDDASRWMVGRQVLAR